MSVGLTIEHRVHFQRRGRAGRKQLAEGVPAAPAGRVPRVARLMALAIRFERLVREGAVRDYAELARLGHVSRARITQIMNLTLLAPDIQEAILFLPMVERGRDPLRLAQLQHIALEPDWEEQRRHWASRTTPRCGPY
jgi:hypothetical protein